jgi:hypothetical protein
MSVHGLLGKMLSFLVDRTKAVLPIRNTASPSPSMLSPLFATRLIRRLVAVNIGAVAPFFELLDIFLVRV